MEDDPGGQEGGGSVSIETISWERSSKLLTLGFVDIWDLLGFWAFDSVGISNFC
jgi:hypothetical protein